MLSKPKSRALFYRSTLAKPAVAVCATLLALCAIELLVRCLDWAPDIKSIQISDPDCVYKRSTNPILGFELKANTRCDAPDFIQTYERTNAHGQRDRERTLRKPEGVKRILLLGDSVVEGYGLRESETLSRQLEALYASIRIRPGACVKRPRLHNKQKHQDQANRQVRQPDDAAKPGPCSSSGFMKLIP
jgi:hypothetical protein